MLTGGTGKPDLVRREPDKDRLASVLGSKYSILILRTDGPAVADGGRQGHPTTVTETAKKFLDKRKLNAGHGLVGLVEVTCRGELVTQT